MARKPTPKAESINSHIISADARAIISEMRDSREERLAMHAEAMGNWRESDQKGAKVLRRVMIARALIELCILIALVIMLVR